ncbi:hypothetical protein [Actinomadura luteofluorescens]|uniref:AraC-like ligand-binding domain-containing protein n=1 Tax=Actinomadura luteofluorescens TaxID=46163 RepID=UPI003D8F6B0C
MSTNELSCEPDLEMSLQARMDIWDLGSLQVALMTTPYVIRRTAKLIRRADPGLRKLGIAADGAGNAAQNDRETAFGVGDLVLYDTSRPYSATPSTDSPSPACLCCDSRVTCCRYRPGPRSPRSRPPERFAARRHNSAGYSPRSRSAPACSPNC